MSPRPRLSMLSAMSYCKITATRSSRLSSIHAHTPVGRRHFKRRCLALCQRAMTALRALSRRCSGVSFAALAFPPLLAPSLPRATAAGFFRRLPIASNRTPSCKEPSTTLRPLTHTCPRRYHTHTGGDHEGRQTNGSAGGGSARANG
jgi:hypothetical protein